MVERVRSSGGQAGKEISDLASRSIDITKRISGELSEVVIPALKVMGSSPFQKTAERFLIYLSLKR
ncbi:MAG: hypothetical protein CM15mV56_230 [uncultured marine virus]|nr:MAG: hypothetical protein CM15mV56_230 [uncultured marine virus]